MEKRIKDFTPIALIGGAFITNSFKDLNPEVQIFAYLLAGIGIIMFLFFKLTSPNDDPVSSRANLNHHPVFNKIESLIIWVQREFTMKNKIKKLVFQDVLYNTLIIYQKRVRDLVRSIFKDKIKDGHELQTRIHFMLNEIIKDINIYYSVNGTSYTQEDKCALIIAIKSFLDWHTKDLTLLLRRVSQVCTDDYFYPSLILKSAIILTFIEGFMSTMIVDVKDAVDEMNGHLKACKYHGEKVGE